MSDGWDVSAKLCGNCKFWPLSGFGSYEWTDGYGRYTSPTGMGGSSCNGDYSPCRRHAPTQAAPKNYGVTAHAVWPETRREEWCGDFEARPVPPKTHSSTLTVDDIPHHTPGYVFPKTQQQEQE